MPKSKKMKKKKMKKVLSASLTASLVASSLPLPHTALAEEATNDSSNANASEETGATSAPAPSNEAASTPTTPTGNAATENTGTTDTGSTTPPTTPVPPTSGTPANNDNTTNAGETAKPANTTPVAPAPEAEKFGGEVSFEVKKDQSLVDKNDIIFKNAKDEVIDIKTVENERTKFDFSKTKKDEEIKFEVTVSGYKKFKGSFTVEEGNQKKVLDLTELDQVTIPSDGVQKIYGDSDFTITPLLKLSSDYNGEIHYTLQSGEEVATVSDSGSVTVKNPGDAVVHITAKRTDNYAAIDATIPLKVAKKNLGQINNSMIEWGPLTKVYDGSTTYAAEGKFKASAGLVGQDEVKVKAEFELNDANVGTQRTTVSQISYVGIADKYQYTSELNEGPTIEVTPKEIHVTTKNVATSYASDDWKVYRSGQIPTAVTLKDVLSFVDVSEKDKAAIDALNLNDAFVLSGSNGDYTVGKAADKLSVTLKNPLLGNYKFVLDKDKSSVEITKDERNTNALWANVLLDEATSKNAFVSGNNVFVKPGGVLNFKLGDTSIYDQLNIKATNLDNPVFGKSLAIPESSISKDVEGVFYLSNSKSADTRTDETAIPNNYKVDADVPVVEFVDGSKIFASIFNAGTTAFSDSKEAIEFAKSNSKTGYVLRLNSSDSGSGLKSVQYSLLKVTSDADAKAKIREAVIGDSLTWKDVENNALQVEPTEEGYYIVVVKAKDNVGNEALYASNGFALDLTNPNVSVTGLPDLTKVHSSAVPYTVTVVDPVTNGVATGIARVDVVVKNNGVEIPNQDGRVNSYSVLSKDLYGQDDLSTFSDFDMAKVEKQFTGSIDADGNNLSLEITAYDKAGNKVTTKEISGIKIDKSGAKVTGTYDNTPLSNSKYLTASRRLTATFTDRNFVEENAKVSFTVDGTTTDYTIEQIRSGAVKGLRLVSDKVDSEAGRVDTAFTNDRTNTYVFEIYNQSNEEHTYSVGLGYSKNGTDYAGEISGEAKDGFVIDNVAPELALQFVNGNKEAVEISKDSSNPTYEHVFIALTLVIKEKNFNPKDVKVTIASKDSKGNAGPAYTYAADALANPDSWAKDNETHTFALSAFTEDANYSIAFEYTDLAGNKVTTDTYYFTVDKTKPTGSLTVVDNGTQVEYGELSDKSTFEHVSSGQLSVKSQSFDETSGIKSVKYYAYKPAVNAIGEFSLPTGSELEQFEWVDNTNDLTFNEDGQVVIYQRMEDKAGNVSYVNTKGALLIDKTAPEKPSIELVTKTAKKDVYNTNVTASIHTEDKEVNGTYSGLQTVKVEVLNQGKVTQSKVYNVASKQARQKEFDGQVTVDAALNNSNDVVIRVTSTDWAGNVSTNEHKFIIDTVAPRIEIVWDNSEAKNGRYYNHARTATVKVYERNFVAEDAKITVNSGEASVSNWVVGSEDSDENVSTATITFAKDGEYTFDVAVTDLAGNSSTKSYKDSFVIDTVAPEANISFHGGTSGAVTGSLEQTKPTYDRSSMTATLNIKEKNFDPKDVVLHIQATDGKGNQIAAYSTSNTTVAGMGAWSNEGDNHSYSLAAFTEDANYSISMEYTDLAGNHVVTPTYYFTVDKTAPVGSLNVSSSDGAMQYKEVKDSASFEHVTSGSVQVGSEADDITSGLASVQYYLYHPDVEARGTFALPSNQALEQFTWSPWTSNLNLDTDQQVVVYQRMEDKAGNVSYVNTSGAIIIDKTVPAKPSIELVTPPSGNGRYNGDVTGKIHVEDQVAGGTYSGLKTVTVEVLNGDRVTQTQTYEVGSKQDRTKAFDTSVVVDSKLNNSNFVKIRVTTTDWAGNVSTGEQELSIDTVAPRIEVSFDTNDGKNGRYYNQARTATVRIYERNFDPNGVNIAIHGGNASISGWSVGSDAGVSDENVNIATITFSEDGDYTFDIQATDQASNSSDYKHTDLFTIDVTKPTLSVSWDKELINGKYVASARTATITVQEHNFDPAGLTAAIKASLESQGISAPSVGGWSSNGDTHTASLTFADDGDYSFTLDFEDMAGNKSETLTENEFTVDSTAPEIAFEGVQDHASYKDEVKPVVRFTDRNFDPSQISLKLKGYRHQEVDLTGSLSEITNGGVVSVADFVHDADVDDVYTLTAETTDKAGNKTSKSITFSVNRFGSNYFFSNQTEQYLEKFYHNKEENIVIHEVNTDSLVRNDLVVTKDASSIKVSKNDYTVEDISSNGWKEYVYTVKASVFEKEGRYEVTIDSEDAAGNKQSNQIKEKPATFVIDKTDPSAVITGVANGEIYNALERDIEIVPTDNILVGKIELLLDGKVVKEFDLTEDDGLNNKFEYKLLESNKWQEVQVKVTDAAGNVATSSKLKVLITPDSMVRFLNSLWFKVIVGTGSTGLLAAILWFVLGKKKKDEEKE